MGKRFEQTFHKRIYMQGQYAHEKMLKIFVKRKMHNHNEIPPHIHENGYNEEDRPHHPLVCLQDACNAHSLLVVENDMGVLENILAVSYTTKHVFIIWLSNFAPSYLLKEKWKHTFTQTFGHSNIIHWLPWWLGGKEPTCNAGDVSSTSMLGRSPGGGNAAHSSILVWRISRTAESGGLQSMGHKRFGHDWATRQQLLCIAATHWKQQKCPSMSKWINKCGLSRWWNTACQ